MGGYQRLLAEMIKSDLAVTRRRSTVRGRAVQPDEVKRREVREIPEPLVVPLPEPTKPPEREVVTPRPRNRP